MPLLLLSTVDDATLTVSKADRLEAARLDRQLARSERYTAPLIKAYSKAVETAAVAAYLDGRNLAEKDIQLATSIDEFAGLAVYVYVEALQQAGAIEGVALSAIGDRAKKLARGFNVNVGKLSRNVKAIVSDSLRDSLHEVKRRINKTLQDITASGVSVAAGRKLLKARLEKMGVTQRNSSYFDTLIKAHTGMAYSAAQWDMATANPKVWGFRYVTMEDERVRPKHAKLHGVVKKKENKIWDSIYPPNGWNCRCRVLPLTKPEAETRLPANAAMLVDEDFRFNPSKQIQ